MAPLPLPRTRVSMCESYLEETKVKTFIPNVGEMKAEWYVIDAAGKPLGRVAAVAAKLLRGKHKPQFTPFLDCGDHVIVINAAKAVVTGAKAQQKMYRRHSGYPGGLRETRYEELVERFPTRPMELAIEGMLPHNRLGRKLATNFRVYAGPEHQQQAQNPKPYEI